MPSSCAYKETMAKYLQVVIPGIMKAFDIHKNWLDLDNFVKPFLINRVDAPLA